jgi:hypothetical protein
MKVILRIKKENFDLIKVGTKKHEWRSPSKYNLDLLYEKTPREDGLKWHKAELTEIEFINGYNKDSPRMTVEFLECRFITFEEDINYPEDNFHALKGECCIKISLGKIISCSE